MSSCEMKRTEEGCCGICSEELRDPVGLPCQHSFCLECLEDWYKSGTDKHHVICPACKTLAPIPQGGMTGFPRLVVVKSSKSITDVDTEAEKSHHVACSICKNKADVHCTQCKKSLCQPCNVNHKVFTTDHKVVMIQELQSGQVTNEGRLCELHDQQQVRYFCETEQKQVCQDCINLKTCPVEHDRVTLKGAAKNHIASIDGLVEKCSATKAKIQDAVTDAEKVLDELTQSKTEAITELDNMKTGYIQRIEQEIQKHKDEVNKLEQERVKEIEDKLKTFKANITQIEAVCKLGSEMSKSKCEYFITNKYPSLFRKLNSLSLTKPVAVDMDLGYLKFKSAIIKTPCIGNLLRRNQWQLLDQFETKDLTSLRGIALNQDGDIVVTSLSKGVKLYTIKGESKGTLQMSDSQGALDVAITPENRCICAPTGRSHIQCYDSQGNHLSTVPITNVDNRQSYVNSVAIDSNGRIILGQVNKTISIHQADGALLTKFATKSTPLHLAVTSNGEIVSSFCDEESKQYKGLQIMDYFGYNARAISPPGEVKIWHPTYVCCSQRQILVVNRSNGDPTGVYKYSAEGDYLGCVTTEVSNPRGIALSDDGTTLFVAEFNGLVKIFH